MEDETQIQDPAKRPGKLRWHPTILAAGLLFVLALIFIGSALIPAEGLVLGGHDMRGYYYPYYELVREAVRQGRLPFWEPTLFNGFPFMAQPQQNIFYPFLWPSFILPVNIGISLYMLLHIWLAGFGMFAFVRFMGGRWLPAVLAGIAFAFSGLLAGRLWAGHSTVYAIDAWTPWLLLALAWCVRKGSWWTAVIAGMPMGLALLAGHIPSFMYGGMIWGLFALYLIITERGKRLTVVRQMAVMLVIGLALAAVQLAPFIEFSFSSGRVAEADYEFATDYSLPPAHLITLLVPEYFGEPTRVGYWSVPTFEELTYYAGLLAILGIVLALRSPSRLSWFYILMMVLGLALALGRYGILYPLAYRFFPPFRIVRAPGRAAFLFLFAAAALLGHAFTNWLNMPDNLRSAKLLQTWRWTLFTIAALGLLAIAATGAVFMAIHPTDTSGRLWHQIGGFSIALTILLLGGGLIWAYLSTPDANFQRRRIIGILLILLTVTDLWLFAYKFVRLESVTPDPFWVDAKHVIGDTEERVIPWGVSLFSQNGAMQVGLNSVFGYDSLEPANHIALASSVPDPRSSAYDVLAARFVIAPTELDQYGDGERPLTLVAQNGAAWVYERERFLPVARLVYEYEVISDRQMAVARVHEPDFDPGNTVILFENPDCQLPSPVEEPGTAMIETREPGFWKIKTESETPAILLLAENAYPGWEAEINGQPADELVAYTAIRALCVPAGTQEITWRYNPIIYQIGGFITLLALTLVIGSLFFHRRLHSTP